MSSLTAVTLLGTACPWKYAGTGINNAGAINSVVSFASGFNDGSTAGGAAGGINTAYRYGQQHTSPAGETNPSTVAVTPGSAVIIQYLSGTVQTQAGGAGNSPPSGSPGIPSLGPNETDGSGYVYPTNYIQGCTTLIGGIVGGFTDSTGQLIAGSLWDWARFRTPSGVSLVLSAVGNVSAGVTTYTGTITGGASNGLVGLTFIISGFTNPVNNGVFNCVASSATTISLNNTAGAAQTQAAKAGKIDCVALVAPAGAAFLTLGINDTILRDNTGSFSLQVVVMESDSQNNTANQGSSGFARYPVGILCTGDGGAISSAYLTTIYLTAVLFPLYDFSTKGILASYLGQLFPHGAQNVGGAPAGSQGQNFPY